MFLQWPHLFVGVSTTVYVFTLYNEVSYNRLNTYCIYAIDASLVKVVFIDRGAPNFHSPKNAL